MSVVIYYNTIDDGDKLAKAEYSVNEKTRNYIQSYIKSCSNGQSLTSGLAFLGSVPPLLTVAYAGGYGFPASNDIIAMMPQFEDLMADSKMIAASATTAVLDTLKDFKFAFIYIDKKMLSKAYVQIAKAESRARDLVVKFGSLVEKSKSLSDQSSKALKNTNENHVKQSEKTREVIELKDKTESAIAGMQASKDGLENAVTKADKIYKEQSESAKEASDKAYSVTMIQAFAMPLYNRVLSLADKKMEKDYPEKDGANSELTKAREEKREAQKNVNTCKKEIEDLTDKVEETPKEEEATKKSLEKQLEAKKKSLIDLEDKLKDAEEYFIEVRNESKKSSTGSGDPLAGLNDDLTKSAKDFREQANKSLDESRKLNSELIKVNSELQKSIKLIEKLAVQKDYLETSVAALGLAIQALAKVTSAFNSAKQFWQMVEVKCKALVKASEEITENSKDNDALEEIVIDSFETAQLNWLCLGVVSELAHRDITAALVKSQKMMRGFPKNKEEAALMVQGGTASISEVIDGENNVLNTSIKQLDEVKSAIDE